MLIEVKVPKNLWNEAVLVAVYLTERSPTNEVSKYNDILSDDEESEVENDGVETTEALPSQLYRGSNLEMEFPRHGKRKR